jgi:hypothetical protein
VFDFLKQLIWNVNLFSVVKEEGPTGKIPLEGNKSILRKAAFDKCRRAMDCAQNNGEIFCNMFHYEA